MILGDLLFQLWKVFLKNLVTFAGIQQNDFYFPLFFLHKKLFGQHSCCPLNVGAGLIKCLYISILCYLNITVAQRLLVNLIGRFGNQRSVPANETRVNKKMFVVFNALVISVKSADNTAF